MGYKKGVGELRAGNTVTPSSDTFLRYFFASLNSSSILLHNTAMDCFEIITPTSNSIEETVVVADTRQIEEDLDTIAPLDEANANSTGCVIA